MRKQSNFNNRLVAETLAMPLSLTSVFAEAGQRYKHMTDVLMNVHYDVLNRLALNDEDREALMKRTFDIVNNFVWAGARDCNFQTRGFHVFYLLKNLIEQEALTVAPKSNMDGLIDDLIEIVNGWQSEGHDPHAGYVLAQHTMAKLKDAGYYSDVSWVVEGI